VAMAADLPQRASADRNAQSREYADIVVRAGAIHSMAEAREADARSYRAMAVRDARIVALAAERDGADDLIGDGTVVVDDPGLTVLPACDDTHTHVIPAGREVNDVQVADAKDLGEFLELIRRRAASAPAGRWIRTAGNWHELQLAERRMPTRQELDSAAADNPVLVKQGGHNDLVNSAGLRLAGSPPRPSHPKAASSSATPRGSRPADSRTPRSRWSNGWRRRRVSTSRSRACG
jgi:predicted amidohydrolase YtcJ